MPPLLCKHRTSDICPSCEQQIVHCSGPALCDTQIYGYSEPSRWCSGGGPNISCSMPISHMFLPIYICSHYYYPFAIVLSLSCFTCIFQCLSNSFLHKKFLLIFRPQISLPLEDPVLVTVFPTHFLTHHILVNN